MSFRTKDGLGIVGVGAAACVACCAGPVLAFLGGLSVAGLAGIALFGMLGVLLAIPAVLALVVVRRRRTACGVASEPVSIAPPHRRVPARMTTSTDMNGAAP